MFIQICYYFNPIKICFSVAKLMPKSPLPASDATAIQSKSVYFEHLYSYGLDIRLDVDVTGLWTYMKSQPDKMPASGAVFLVV